MCKEAFSKRLVQLRMAKGVSARDMSLSLGQNPGYINSIENNKTLALHLPHPCIRKALWLYNTYHLKHHLCLKK